MVDWGAQHKKVTASPSPAKSGVLCWSTRQGRGLDRRCVCCESVRALVGVNERRFWGSLRFVFGVRFVREKAQNWVPRTFETFSTLYEKLYLITLHLLRANPAQQHYTTSSHLPRRRIFKNAPPPSVQNRASTARKRLMD